MPMPEGLLDRLAGLPVRAHGVRDPVLVPPVTEYPNARETHIAAWRRRNAILHQQWLEDRRRENGVKLSGNWRLILRRLHSNTPEDAIQCTANEAKIFVPNKDSFLHTPDGESFVASTRRETGCTVVDWEDGEDMPCLLLRGAKDRVADAINRIVRVDNMVKIVACSGSTNITLFDATVPPVPGTWDTLTEGFHILLGEDVYYTEHDVSLLPVPSEWQPSSLLDYVKTLVQSRMKLDCQRITYRDGMTHEAAVSRRLLEVFCSGVPDSALTIEAVNLALTYMCRDNIPYTYPLRFFSRMKARIPFNIHTYNILFDAVSRQKDPVEFHRHLLDMLRDGFQPTFYTWLLFFRLFEAEEVKRYVLHVMKSKNLLLARGSMAILSHEMIEHDVYRALKLGHSLDTFLASQNGLYGPHWLNVRSGTRLLDVLGRYGRFKDMMRIVDMIFASTLEETIPAKRALTAILVHCQHYGSAHNAIQFLGMFEKRGVHPDKYGWEALFQLMSQGRKPHQLSIVWRYALLSNNSSWKMRREAIRLLFNKKVPTLVRHLTQERNHLPPGLRTFLMDLLALDYWREDPEALERLKGTFSPGEAVRAVAEMKRFYSRLGSKWLPRWPLSEMLRQAYEVDVIMMASYKSSGMASPLTPLSIPFMERRGMGGGRRAAKVFNRSRLARMMLGSVGYGEGYQPLKSPAAYHPTKSLASDPPMRSGTLRRLKAKLEGVEGSADQA